ncbi:hypothetical protein HHI36_018749 [Cryptolaemus montrouzieri]|uniref:Uncharacterized protein n=1 Tax=Cryptolaemus montrouzieri TaxID=559131 RepID=A0ABD2P1M4_9CUCU
MELKYIVLTIIKILVSVPTILFTSSLGVDAAAMMGGYLDNRNDTNHFADVSFDTEESYREQFDQTGNHSSEENFAQYSDEINKSEEMPNPSPLVIAGYNLPENIFNKGKPFYLEKDPLTGQVNFSNKAEPSMDDDFYDFSEESQQSDDIFHKSNIDRKDGNIGHIGSHRPSDINQLSPTFHDFLNLPIKYNSDKYVYPLISSSYANMKVQGNVNKYHNHKTHETKFSTVKPPKYTYSSSPTTYSHSFDNHEVSTSTTTTRTTSTEAVHNLMSSSVDYPNYNEEFSEEYYEHSEVDKNKFETDIKEYPTTNRNQIYLTTSAPQITTKKVMSLFEQLFGDYDETVTTTQATKVPSSFSNEYFNSASKPGNDKVEISVSTQYPSNNQSFVNVATGSNMEMEYENYDDYVYNNQNISEISSTSNPYSIRTTTPTTTTTTSKSTQPSTIYNSHSYKEPSKSGYLPTTRPRPDSTTDPYLTSRITSLPLGENHLSTPLSNGDNHASYSNNYGPIIIATQNLRDQLNNEKVVPKPFSVHIQHAPSTSNIHIPPDQDMVSFVVGHHQSMDGGTYTDSNSPNILTGNSFQPLYGGGSHEKEYINNNSPDTVIFQPPEFKKHQEPSGSVVTIQTQTNSEASLSIGDPVQSIKKIPGLVMDEKLELENVKPEVSSNGPKIVFPTEKEISLTSLIPPASTPNPIIASQNREILQLATKPMYHQLPSSLTPPKEKEGKRPVRLDSPRPPWDPRPGHFFSGKLEYSRPPRPFPDMAYKRIDNLPNILPQFRPNMISHVSPGGNPLEYKHMQGVHRGTPNFYDKRLQREPLLERPSNKPLEFYEKLQPPPLPPKNLYNLRKIPQQIPNQRSSVAQDRKGEDYHNKPLAQPLILEPPKVLTNMKNNDGEVETLQMLQAKQSDKKEIHSELSNNLIQDKNKTEKPVYVVYPINTSPIKLDVINTNEKENVVVGTRAEVPLPPSEITLDIQNKNSLLGMKDRNDSPVLKPQSRPAGFPMKSEFPYPLERPDISILYPVPDAPNNGIGSEDNPHSDNEGEFISNNQWNTIGNIESRIVNGVNNQNHIYTEKPIAVAYTPTEPESHKYPIQNEDIDRPDIYHHPIIHEQSDKYLPDPNTQLSNHRIEENSESVNVRTEQDFQAPFQASVKVDSPSQGWSVIRKTEPKFKNDQIETTTIIATTREFDIESFKPQLEGGFKPIYTIINDDKEIKIVEREE